MEGFPYSADEAMPGRDVILARTEIDFGYDYESRQAFAKERPSTP